MSNAQHHRSRVAALTKSRKPNDPELAAARAELVAANLETYIRTMVERAPQLSDTQRDALAALLRGGSR